MIFTDINILINYQLCLTITLIISRETNFCIVFFNSVEMKAVTWSKDSHGLFDYESRSVQVKKFKIDSSCRICRNISLANTPENDNDISIFESKKQMDLDPNIR